MSALRLYLNENPRRTTAEGRTGARARPGRGEPREAPAPRGGGHLSAVAARAAKKVEGLIAKGVSTDYPEEQDVCWKKASDLIRTHDLTVAVSPAR